MLQQVLDALAITREFSEQSHGELDRKYEALERKYHNLERGNLDLKTEHVQLERERLDQKVAYLDLKHELMQVENWRSESDHKVQLLEKRVDKNERFVQLGHRLTLTLFGYYIVRYTEGSAVEAGQPGDGAQLELHEAAVLGLGGTDALETVRLFTQRKKPKLNPTIRTEALEKEAVSLACADFKEENVRSSFAWFLPHFDAMAKRFKF